MDLWHISACACVLHSQLQIAVLLCYYDFIFIFLLSCHNISVIVKIKASVWSTVSILPTSRKITSQKAHINAYNLRAMPAHAVSYKYTNKYTYHKI